MKIMCDTNIILDVLLERQPFVEDSYKVLSLCEEHRLEGFVSASSVTRSEEHTSELQSRFDLVCRLLLEKKKRIGRTTLHTLLHVKSQVFVPLVSRHLVLNS